ncbi:MAG: exodeoxyribonuclease VII small subunit [Candidatus Deianiraeaceae bacterium]|jgi:exodeoxyribonuclease VII small subunit
MAKITLEEKIHKLEALAVKIENGNLSINEVVALHKESVKIIKECKEEVSQIENTIISNDNDN